MENGWTVNEIKPAPKLNNPILIEGMPGIGNVGKIAIDFMIQELKAKELCSLMSDSLPNSVFVNEQDLIELPSITIYFKKFSKKGKRDIIILTGDVQPVDEKSSYALCHTIINLAQKHKVKDIITTAGIGLNEVPEKPNVYITGNSKKAVAKYKEKGLESKIHGKVGSIIGISGLLLGLSKPLQIDGIGLLAETFGHPMYLGAKGAIEIVQVLNDILGVKINAAKLRKETELLEIEKPKLASLNQMMSRNKNNETTYIG